MTQSPTISEGIDIFLEKFEFHNSKNTQRAYSRAARLFYIFLCEPNGVSSTTGLCGASQLSDLPKTVLSDFLGWLHHRPYAADYRERPRGMDEITPLPSGKAYATATINLYETSVRHILEFWRVRGWLSFSEASQDEVIKASGTNHQHKNREINRRAGAVPEDFGTVMFAAATRMVAEVLTAPKATHLERLEALRAKCLIHVLMATGLRASDMARLTLQNIEKARALGGYMEVQMQKTRAPAYCYLFGPVFDSIDAYLAERQDRSPWLFIQHGRSGKKRQKPAEFFADSTSKGYGAPISTTTVWRIVRSVATAAGYKESDAGLFIAPHGMRHWYAQTLRDAGVPIDDIQAALGHASAETTKTVYAPIPNLDHLVRVQERMQRATAEVAEKSNSLTRNAQDRGKNH